jgi:hypothetical protein
LKTSFADIIATYGRTKAEHLIYGGPGFDNVDDADLESVIIGGVDSSDKSVLLDTPADSDTGGGDNFSNESVPLDTSEESGTNIVGDIAPAGSDVSVIESGFFGDPPSPISIDPGTDNELDLTTNSEESTAQQLIPQHDEVATNFLDLSSDRGSIKTSGVFPVPKKPKFQNISVRMHNNAIECLSKSRDDYWELEPNDNKEIIRTVCSIEIDVRKFKTLAPNHYLCDDIIDCHFQMLQKAMNKPVERELLKAFRKGESVLSTMKLEVLVYSAQFIAKIFTLNGRNSFEYHVWLPTLSIMTYNYLLIPVNIDNQHWVLIVIRPLLQSIELYDSMGGNPTIYFEPLKRWLTERLQEDCSGWKCSFHKCLNVDGRRQQQDDHNCGCYVINNARKAVGFRTDNRCQRKHLAIDVLRGFI